MEPFSVHEALPGAAGASKSSMPKTTDTAQKLSFMEVMSKAAKQAKLDDEMEDEDTDRKEKSHDYLTDFTAHEGHSHAVFCVAFHPEGRLLLSASGDKTVKLWDLQACDAPRKSEATQRRDGRSPRLGTVPGYRDWRPACPPHRCRLSPMSPWQTTKVLATFIEHEQWVYSVWHATRPQPTATRPQPTPTPTRLRASRPRLTPTPHAHGPRLVPTPTRHAPRSSDDGLRARRWPSCTMYRQASRWPLRRGVTTAA